MSKHLHWLRQARQRYRRIGDEALPRNVMALLEAAAAATPDAAALHFIEPETTLTYAELLRDVRRLAAGLAAVGVARGSHVAVMLPNIREMPTTWLALAALGAVMVPVNIRYTGHELHYVITDSEATHLVIHDACQALLRELPAWPPMLAAVIVAGEPASDGYLRWHDLIAGASAAFAPDIEPDLDDVLNIQYTSGTTGWPKGCLLTQRYWLTCAKAYAASDGLRYRRILSSNPFFYMTPAMADADGLLPGRDAVCRAVSQPDPVRRGGCASTASISAGSRWT